MALYNIMEISSVLPSGVYCLQYIDLGREKQQTKRGMLCI
jgi:hypothetical protein